jgi:hypothetical protein
MVKTDAYRAHDRLLSHLPAVFWEFRLASPGSRGKRDTCLVTQQLGCSRSRDTAKHSMFAF